MKDRQGTMPGPSRMIGRISPILLPLALLALLTLPACTEKGPALAGAWYAEPVHLGETGHIGLEIGAAEDGGLAAKISLFDAGMLGIPLGPVEVRGDEVAIGPLTFAYAEEGPSLTGSLPPTFTPGYAIPMTFHRVQALEPPATAVSRAPAVEPVWTFDTGASVWAGIATDRGTVFAGSDGGKIHALDAEDGTEIWSFATAGPIRARPTISDDDLLVLSDDGHVYKLGARDGSLRWKARVQEDPVSRLGFGDEGFLYDHYGASPTAARGIVYVGTHEGSLHALDRATGKALWRFECGDRITSSAAVAGERVFFGSFDGHVYALESSTGELIWKHDTGAPVTSSPALYEDLIIIGSRSYDLLALSVEDGSPIWNQYFWFSWIESSATVHGDFAFVGSSDAQELRAFVARDGSRLWRFDGDGWLWAQPAVSESAVFIGASGAGDYASDHRAAFHAVNRETGTGIWRFDLAPPGPVPIWGFAAAPALGETLVFAGSLDGRILAFEQALPED